MLAYVPKLNKDQFFQTSFATQKCQMTIDLIKLVQQKCKSFQTNEKVIVGGGGSGGNGASSVNLGDKVVTASSSMYSLSLKSNVQNGSTGGSGNASSSSSSSISSYGNMAETNDLKVRILLEINIQ